MMHKKPIPIIFHKFKKSAVIILTAMLLTGISYQLTSVILARYRHLDGNDDAGTKNQLEKISEYGWEAHRLIYHGIPARILFYLPPDADTHPDALNDAAWLEFERIGKIFNPFKPDSEISRINLKSQSGPIYVSDELYSVLRISGQLWRNSNGLFDPTMWQIKQLWQNAEKNQQLPDKNDIAAALQWTGFDKIRFDDPLKNSFQFVSHPVKFDFGGVVKGYAVDQVREILLHSGVTAGLVQLGGEICTFGNNNGKPWRIGIQHPKQMDKVWGVISYNDSLRVSTSGNYRQPILINGKYFYHIFSPKTGMPVSEKVLGVTTVSIGGKETNARLDGIATAITVMGAAKGLKLAEKLNIDAVILYKKSNGTIGESVTPGILDYYDNQDLKN